MIKKFLCFLKGHEWVGDVRSADEPDMVWRVCSRCSITRKQETPYNFILDLCDVE